MRFREIMEKHDPQMNNPISNLDFEFYVKLSVMRIGRARLSSYNDGFYESSVCQHI